MDVSAVKPIFEELRKWANPEEASLALTHAKLEASCGRYASNLFDLS